MNQTPQIYPDQLPERERPGYLRAALIASPICSVGLLVIGLLQLGIGGGGLMGTAKIALIALGAFIASYSIYRMAIEKSATLATKGYKFATVLGGLTTFLVGLAFFIATAAGLIITACEELRLQEYNRAVLEYSDARAAQAGQATRMVPVVEAIAADLSAKAECEVASSCVSGRGPGGYGPTARLLETLAGRSSTIAQKAAGGLGQRDAALDNVATVIARMDTILADESRTIWERRSDLRKLDGELGRVLNALDEAVPLALMSAFAQELRAGVSTPNAQVTDTINGALSGYAGSIEAVLAGMNVGIVERPGFPARTGALQTFAYASNFAPVILLAFLIDMVFPLALWGYTLMGLDWIEFQRNPARKRTELARGDFDDLTEFQVMDMPKRPNGHAEPRPVHRPNPRNHRNGGN
jgi:hypothetical protein